MYGENSNTTLGNTNKYNLSIEISSGVKEVKPYVSSASGYTSNLPAASNMLPSMGSVSSYQFPSSLNIATGVPCNNHGVKDCLLCAMRNNPAPMTNASYASYTIGGTNPYNAANPDAFMMNQSMYTINTMDSVTSLYNTNPSAAAVQAPSNLLPRGPSNTSTMQNNDVMRNLSSASGGLRNISSQSSKSMGSSSNGSPGKQELKNLERLCSYNHMPALMQKDEEMDIPSMDDNASGFGLRQEKWHPDAFRAKFEK